LRRVQEFWRFKQFTRYSPPSGVTDALAFLRPWHDPSVLKGWAAKVLITPCPPSATAVVGRRGFLIIVSFFFVAER
jgi:hypothetical protein